MAKLTTQDLEAALASPDHLGYGYANRADPEIPLSAQVEMDKLVIEEANAKGWTFKQLFEWSNSKWGRWFVEECVDTLYANKPLSEVKRDMLTLLGLEV